MHNDGLEQEDTMVFKQQTFHGEEPEIVTAHPTVAAVEANVAGALAVSGGIDASEVTVAAHGTTVALDGSVLSEPEIERASEVALAVPGVTNVENRIRAK